MLIKSTHAFAKFVLDSYKKIFVSNNAKTNKLEPFEDCVFLQVITELKLNDKK